MVVMANVQGVILAVKHRVMEIVKIYAWVVLVLVVSVAESVMEIVNLLVLTDVPANVQRITLDIAVKKIAIVDVTIRVATLRVVKVGQ